MKNLNNLKYNKDGLVTIVVQDIKTKTILQVAYAKKEHIEKTLKTKLATFFSRSRQKEWIKGETSNNFQHVEKVLIDCDMDAVIYLVNPDGPACHTNNYTCFYREVSENGEFNDE